MSSWISEQEFRQGGGQSAGIAINVPFLQEIKQDFEFRQLLNEVQRRINDPQSPSPREASELLASLRDQLETYFALEEFYGYFKYSQDQIPTFSRQAEKLKEEHSKLYLQFNQIVDASEQILYQECSKKLTVKQLGEMMGEFCKALAQHEEDEMELMMQICNQDIGVGD